MTTKLPATDIPEDLAPLFRSSPFLDALGPFFYRPTKSSFVIGLRIATKHANARGSAHGGLLLTLADIALGYTASASSDPPLALTTVNIVADFAGHAQVGDWLKAQVDIQKIGRRLVFANAYLMVGVERNRKSKRYRCSGIYVTGRTACRAKILGIARFDQVSRL